MTHLRRQHAGGHHGRQGQGIWHSWAQTNKAVQAARVSEVLQLLVHLMVVQLGVGKVLWHGCHCPHGGLLLLCHLYSSSC